MTTNNGKGHFVREGQQARVEAIELEMNWFQKVCNTRMRSYFKLEESEKGEKELDAPELPEESEYAQLIKQYQLGVKERMVLMLALVPHVRPQVLDVFFNKNSVYDRGYSEFGGLKGMHHSGFLPTVETALFVLAGKYTGPRIEAMTLFEPEHPLVAQGVLQLGSVPPGDPSTSAALQLAPEYLLRLTTGNKYHPSYNAEFPAKYISTNMNWDDLILDEKVLKEVQEIEAWIRYEEQLMQHWELGKVLKRGYRSLFYGPPGTGKTLTACLLGKSTGLDVYRVDLSLVVSKYIGETEKNLSKVFDQAEHRKWILFFDEADALFGKRTSTSSSNDRHANQEVAYLLQRVEDFPGVVILATNLKGNIDEAFARRFQSMIHFPMPEYYQRKQIWDRSFSKKTQMEEGFDLDKIAFDHELAGGSIVNVMRLASLRAAMREENVIRQKDVLEGIRREFAKEGKTV